MNRLEHKLMHRLGRAATDYNMIQRGDRVMVCLSGGKDSFTLLRLLNRLRIRSNHHFELFSYTLDQGQPGWDDGALREWLAREGIPYEIERRDTYSVVTDKVPEGKTYCSLCSRLRRGNIYRYAAEHGFTKIALGHHRDDLIESLLMSILYSGEIRSMPPKLITDNRRHVVVRPLAYCREQDISEFAAAREFPIIPCKLCGSQEGAARTRVKALISELGHENRKVASNILNALGNIQISQLMDQRHWDFRNLEEQLEGTGEAANADAPAEGQDSPRPAAGPDRQLLPSPTVAKTV